MAQRDCPHNSGVTCDGRTICTHCGFYPPEEKRRLTDILEDRLKTGAWGRRWLGVKKKGGAACG